ncbi:hypothetical protein [Oceanobacillus sp. CAU 1775]
MSHNIPKFTIGVDVASATEYFNVFIGGKSVNLSLNPEVDREVVDLCL